MLSALKRLNPAISTVALVVALLALVVSAAGVGYAAATIGTSDIKKNAVTASKIKKNAVTAKKIKNNAVTSGKVKDGTLIAGDLVAEEVQRLATLANGGEGDCLWQGGGGAIPSVGVPTFRKDRFGRVHVSGVAFATNAPGGDGVCDPTDPGQASDGIAFTLPAGYIPAKSQLVPGDDLFSVVVGAEGISIPGVTLPPGSVYNGDIQVLLDGVSFDPAGSSVVLAKTKSSDLNDGRLLEMLGIS